MTTDPMNALAEWTVEHYESLIHALELAADKNEASAKECDAEGAPGYAKAFRDSAAIRRNLIAELQTLYRALPIEDDEQAA